jgi:hypothetical protein
MGSRQVGQLDIFDEKLAISIGNVWLARKLGRVHGEEDAGGAGMAGLALSGAGFGAEDAPRGGGITSGPFCPQPVTATALAARTISVTRIWRTFNMGKL